MTSWTVTGRAGSTRKRGAAAFGAKPIALGGRQRIARADLSALERAAFAFDGRDVALRRAIGGRIVGLVVAFVVLRLGSFGRRLDAKAFVNAAAGDEVR